MAAPSMSAKVDTTEPTLSHAGGCGTPSVNFPLGLRLRCTSCSACSLAWTRAYAGVSG